MWQLADEIRPLVYAFTRRPSFRIDAKLKAQTDDAIESVCRNIAEGFAGSHKQFRNYLVIAKGSLNELTDCLRAAHLKGYVTSEDLLPIWQYTRRLFPALSSLIAHLETTDDQGRPLPHQRSNRHP